MGVSRSCTCAMAYMMKTHGWTAVQTMRQFRANRDVRPNDGFMRYIVAFDNREISKRPIFNTPSICGMLNNKNSFG